MIDHPTSSPVAAGERAYNQEQIESPREISHSEARMVFRRFLNSHFNREGTRPKACIPADLEHDDDIVLMSYIAQQERRASSPPAAKCAKCDGEGEVSGYDPGGFPGMFTCRECKGSGQVPPAGRDEIIALIGGAPDPFSYTSDALARDQFFKDYREWKDKAATTIRALKEQP